MRIVIDKQPLTFGMLARIGMIHPPTANYIVERRLRGIPPEGIRMGGER